MINILIFGASGDISRKKVIPGLYEWYREIKESNQLNVIGYGRTEMSDEKFRERIINNEFVKDEFVLNKDEAEFTNCFTYITGQYNSEEGFIKIYNKLKTYAIDGPLIVYFGVPSKLSKEIIVNMLKCKISSQYDCKYLIEKPIGNNLEDAQILLNKLDFLVGYDKIFILDHYLGKSSIQDINLSKNKNVKELKIYLDEKETADHRLEYFDNVGIFKDMVQSHVLTLISHFCPELLININLNDIKIQNYEIGQYNGYKGSPKTETFIFLEIKWKEIYIKIHLGKKLEFDRKQIIYKYTTSESSNVDIITLKSRNSEYKVLFQDALINDKTKFLSSKNIIDFWNISDYIWNKIKNKKFIKY
tara:strand:- start:1432 stop:2511 length:1080 start_codon:yes stop_codon:yes gene_type:complete